MRMVMDSVGYAAVRAIDWPHKIGYFNGTASAWPADVIAAERARGQLLALVDVLGDAPYGAAILDVERGDVTAPEIIRAWVIARNQFRRDAVVYCNRSTLPTVISALAGEPCRIWLANPADNGEPPMTVPDLGLPAHITLLGVQYVLSPRSGGNYDLSVFYDDTWHGDRESAEAASAAVPKPEAVPGPAGAAPVPVAPATPSPAGTGDTPAPVTPSGDIPAAAEMAAAPALQVNDPAAGSTPAPDPAEQLLPHGFIQHVITDVRQVAGLFRGAGAGHVAQLLEEAVSAAAETGALLQRAGL